MITDLSAVNCSDLDAVDGLAMALNVAIDGENMNDWLAQNSAHLKRLQGQNGALLLRGVAIQGSKKLARVLTSIWDDKLLNYEYRSTPRSSMRGQIYTSSEYHPAQTITLHSENAYANSWAMNIAFYCVKAAEQGGATPIADCRKVYQAIDPEIREMFQTRKLQYVRNYGDVDLPWTEVFQTHDRSVVEQYCNNNGIAFEWKDQNGLRTRQIGNAAYLHPRSGEKVWFNQAHLFHISSHDEAHLNSLKEMFKPEDLPRNVYFADGGEIPEAALAEVRRAYLENQVVFDWQEQDLLLLDNMMFAHGRQPYVGERRVLVGMSSPISAEQLSC